MLNANRNLNCPEYLVKLTTDYLHSIDKIPFFLADYN